MIKAPMDTYLSSIKMSEPLLERKSRNVTSFLRVFVLPTVHISETYRRDLLTIVESYSLG